jgi:hypothetical protein
MKQMKQIKIPKNPNFCCEKCEYTTDNKKDYSKHLSTLKHQNETNETLLKQPTPQKSPNDKKFSCLCGVTLNSRTTLWRHKKSCNFNPILEKEPFEETEKENNDSNNDLIQYLISENKEFKNLILEVCKNLPGTNMNNCYNVNHVNSHNKTFNLQFFLNETCKDAMNMSEFIKSVKIQLSDLENVGKLGFVDGISNIIIKNLEALEVEKRPVHCCDAKRETMYIKDHDKWEKEDNELKQMRELVRYVRDKNISMVNTWRDMYPECVKSDSKKTTQYNEIYMESFGGETGGEKGTKKEKEEKIISRIAKAVIINKEQ